MYYDVALSSSLQALSMLFQLAPNDHILYGVSGTANFEVTVILRCRHLLQSDFPYAPPPAYPKFLEQLETYDMDPEQREDQF